MPTAACSWAKRHPSPHRATNTTLIQRLDGMEIPRSTRTTWILTNSPGKALSVNHPRDGEIERNRTFGGPRNEGQLHSQLRRPSTARASGAMKSKIRSTTSPKKVELN